MEGWNVSAGLRYQFTPERSQNSVKDSPHLASWQDYNWTGLYIGGSAGKTSGEERWHYVSFGTQVDPEFGGYLLGGQVGYNFQLGRVVVGVEGDYAGTNANAGARAPPLVLLHVRSRGRPLSICDGRLGYTWGRALFYAKGGWAGGEVVARTAFEPGFDPRSLCATCYDLLIGQTAGRSVAVWNLP